VASTIRPSKRQLNIEMPLEKVAREEAMRGAAARAEAAREEAAKAWAVSFLSLGVLCKPVTAKERDSQRID
jgi:hypothetical protein